MKKIKVIALAMALVMLAMCAVACGGEKVSVPCTISIVVDGETYLDSYAYTVEGKADNPPTVLQAVSEALQTLEWGFEIDETGKKFASITVAGVDYVGGMSADGTYIGFWEYKADGVAPKEGMPGDNAILENQHIVFSFEKEIVNEETFSDPE